MLGTIIGLLLSPVTAQRNKFNTIQCSQLEVVDYAGEVQVHLGTDIYGGSLIVFREGGGFVTIGSSEHNSGLSVFDKEEDYLVMIGYNKHGGQVGVFSKGKGDATMGIDKSGNGVVVTKDKNGYRDWK